ncbi:hypothetical protein [Escherichia sp. MOD1-EC7003]|uniref:hypothetical protein n=1 Tax=Escherichia sp. MOD1-EC7003 TaxID=2093900 RepID=UPI001F060D94|nr:hypothetical protein [Escherichia sp. MOD1-EC7003]
MHFYRSLFFMITLPFCCFAESIKDVIKCDFNKNDGVTLVSLKTIDGDTPYLLFENIIVSAFLDGAIYSGDIVLSKCVNHSLIFALNYGPPYIKGCLITSLNHDSGMKNKLKGFCFAERNIPEAIWFGKKKTLIIIKNDNRVGEWREKYIIYDSSKEAAYDSYSLPEKKGYEIYPVISSK